MSIYTEGNRYVVNENKYIARTKNVCAICTAAADGRQLWIKQIIPNGDIILECAWCETTVAKHVSSVVRDTQYEEL